VYNLSIDKIVQASNKYWKTGERKDKAACSGSMSCVPGFVTPHVKMCDIMPYRGLPTTTYISAHIGLTVLRKFKKINKKITDKLKKNLG
jgi:hypothetical protein